MRDLIRINVSLNQIICHDEGDGLGNAEPYLWTVFFKIDGSTVRLNDNLFLEGTASVYTTPGSHGNLNNNDVDEGDVVNIPAAIGQWDTLLSPIPVPQFVKDLGTDDVAAIAGVVCVLMEEDNVTDDGANAGHDALNTGIQSALDALIPTLGFTNQEVTDADLEALTDRVTSAVEDAIKNQQNIFENIWSWLNKDDTIGSVVFRFNQDQLLSNGVTNLNKRWKNEGDWELNGDIAASVACAADSLKILTDILKDIFSNKSNGEMRQFRIKEMPKYRHLHRWWSLADRNFPHVLRLAFNDSGILKTSLELHRSMDGILNEPDKPIEGSFWKQSRSLLRQLKEKNPRHRRLRIDTNRALAIIDKIEGKSTNEVFQILNTIEPARHSLKKKRP